MIVFVHTKFGLVRIQGSEVKRGGGRNPPPRSERVFQIPVQIGLSNRTIMHQFSQTLVNSQVYPSELLSVKELTSSVSKHNTKVDNHLQIVKYTL